MSPSWLNLATEIDDNDNSGFSKQNSPGITYIFYINIFEDYNFNEIIHPTDANLFHFKHMPPTPGHHTVLPLCCQVRCLVWQCNQCGKYSFI